MKMVNTAETHTEGKDKLADGFTLGTRLPGTCAAREKPERFTDTELQAAVNLVLLSESSSASVGRGESRNHPEAEATTRRRAAAHSYSSADSSSLASVNTAHPAAAAYCGGAVDDDEVGESGGAWADSDSDPMVDEDTTGPWARVRRYKSLRGLYLVTDRMDGAIRKMAVGRKRNAVPKARLPALQQPMATERPKRKRRV